MTAEEWMWAVVARGHGGAEVLESVRVPVPEPGVVHDRIVLTGDVPTPIAPPSGCPFRTRCYKAEDVCATQRPVLEPVQGSTEHQAACYFPEPLTSERNQ